MYAHAAQAQPASQPTAARRTSNRACHEELKTVKNCCKNKKMIFNKNHDGNCWWCGNSANSKEHKIKRTDFVHVFGKGPYQNKDNRPVLVKNGKEILIQSPKSDYIKFNDCFCGNCNNHRSSEMDKYYSQFMEYTRKNEEP